MDYCEIILDSVHKVVSAEMAKELKKLQGTLVIAKILEVVESNSTYLVQEEEGRRVTVTADPKLVLNINDYVYLSGTTIIAKKLDNSQVPISINESLKDFISFWSLENTEGKTVIELQEAKPCNRLLVSAKVKSGVTKESNYNISIKVVNKQNQVYGLDFTQLDLMGRLDRLGGSLQKQMYGLQLKDVVSAEASFDSETYSSVTLSLGANREALTNEMGLKLSTSVKELEYKTDTKGKVIIDDITFPISWSWIYIDENDVLQNVSSGKSLRYYRYNESYNAGDEYGGLNWELITIADNEINKNCLLPNQNTTRIKAVIVNGQEIFTSNELEFKNIILTREGIISNMRLKFSDGRNGNYPLYTPSGNLLAKYSIESCKERKVVFTFVNVDESKDINNLVKKVEWTIDVDKINISNQIKNDPNVRNSAPKIDSAGNKVVICDTTNRITNDKTPKPNWHSFEFFIKNSIDFDTGLNDLISCAVTLDGDDEPYIASAPLTFTTDLAGNNGYSVAFELIEDGTGKLCYSADAYKNYTLNCRLWDKDGQKLSTDDYSATASWYGGKGSNNNNRAFDLPTGASQSFKLTSRSSNKGWSSACHIIQFNIEIKIKDDETRTIKMLYPLAVRSKDFDAYYDGPTEFVYDASGRAESTNLTNVVKFIDSDGSEIEGTSFELRVATLTGIGGGWHPTLSGNGTTKRTLIAPNYYESKLKDQSANYICHIKFVSGGKNFTQPIILYQNTQFSTYIDEWGGELTVDEDKNAILSASIVAGTKNSKNQFTGIVAGDVENIADNGTTTLTSGILGFQEGVQSFGLNTDGTAFFGKSGAGQIKFDGNGGSIQSGNYNGTSNSPQPTTGMLIDIDGGAIYSPGFSFDPSGNVNLMGNITWGTNNRNNPKYDFSTAILLSYTNGTTISRGRAWAALQSYTESFSSPGGWQMTSDGYKLIFPDEDDIDAGIGKIIKVEIDQGITDRGNATPTYVYFVVTGKGTSGNNYVAVKGTGKIEYPSSVDDWNLKLSVVNGADGIYNSTTGSGAPKIGINATMIKTGTLQVGGTSADNALLYANVKSPSVKIAGWTVNNSSITTGRLGSANGFHMYSSGYKTKDASTKKYFGQSTDKTWMLGIGSNFGVTSYGEIYATAGTIANLTIGNGGLSAASNSGHYSGIRMSGSENWHKTIYAAASDNMGNNAQFYVTNAGYMYAKNAEIEGKITATSGSIGGWELGAWPDYSDAYYLKSGTLGANDSVHLYTAFHGGDTSIAGHTDGSWRLTIGPNFGVNNLGHLYAAGGQIGNLSIGSGGLYAKSDSGHYSGIRMSGSEDWYKTIYAAASDNMGNNAKFYVTNDGYMYAKNAEIEGKITATSGSFTGTITASQGEISDLTIGSCGLYGKSDSGYYTGIRMNGAENSYKTIYAAASDNVGTNAQFYVTNAGYMYAKNAEIEGKITASSGRIGSASSGFTISDSALGTYSTSNNIVTGTQISTADGIYTSNIRANILKLRAGVSTNQTNRDVGTIYILWPALDYTGGEGGEEYYGAITSKGIMIIYQNSSNTWQKQKSLVSYS